MRRRLAFDLNLKFAALPTPHARKRSPMDVWTPRSEPREEREPFSSFHEHSGGASLRPGAGAD